MNNRRVKDFRTIIIFITSVSMLVITSCKKEKPCQTNEYTVNIPDDILSKLIYKGYERLVFVDSNTNDTHIFLGQGYVIDYATAYTQEDCPDKYLMQRKYVVFKSSTYTKPITASLNYYSISSGEYLEVNFNNTVFIGIPTDIGPPGPIDSMLIIGKKYYDVAYFKKQYRPQPTDKFGCYYNITSGILKMETKDGHKWELVRIE